MVFKQFYLGCLAHASYLIGSEGEAAVVDPRRDVDLYLDEAKSQGLTIRYVIETHLHADFVSGHRELAERTGAIIVFGAKAEALFPHRAVHEGDELRVGKVVLRILETPGHTAEGISVLVIDTEISDQPQKVLTGDTLFIGDVGRPDLVASKGISPEEMAGMLHDSLHQKLMTLDDAVEVYPAHGAGSLCGRNISRETSSTVGEQRKFNYALRPMTKMEFVRMMTTDLPEAPQYFSMDAELNRAGAPALGSLPLPAPLTPHEVRRMAEQGYTILDVRPAAAFGTAHVPGALHIGLGGQFASWSGVLLASEKPIIIVADEEAAIDEAVIRLARVGVENVKGYLAGGMYAWHKTALKEEMLFQIPVDELRKRIEEQLDLQIIDVRRPAEYAAAHMPGAINIDLSRFDEGIARSDPTKPTAVTCASGYRSSIAASIMSRKGFRNLFNVVGGVASWTAAGYPLEQA